MGILSYELLDSGAGRKLERFGERVVDRPRGQAVWRRRLPDERWAAADAAFEREGTGRWHFRRSPPQPWMVELDGLRLRLEATDFGHVGVFPEHVGVWRWMSERLGAAARQANVLNLFAHTGGGTLALARAGARVCHLDASRKSVAWARENAALNGMADAPVRWIAEDAAKFVAREVRRGVAYDGILLDPPSFGRGTRQEVFKFDDDIGRLLEQCRCLLSPEPIFVALTCHTAGHTPLTLSHLLGDALAGLPGAIECREMAIEGAAGVLPVPSGAFAGWRR